MCQKCCSLFVGRREARTKSSNASSFQDLNDNHSGEELHRRRGFWVSVSEHFQHAYGHESTTFLPLDARTTGDSDQFTTSVAATLTDVAGHASTGCQTGD
jgi:hypothetical protein